MNAIFTEKFDSDARAPNLIFEVEGIGSFGVVSDKSPEYWMHFGLLLAIVSTIDSLLAALVFHFVVKKPGTTTSLVYTYGIVIPLALLLPFLLIPWLEIRNIAFVFAVASPQVFTFLRCLEALHGTLPPFAKTNMRSFVFYFIAPVQFNFDPATNKVAYATASEIRSKYWKILNSFVQCVLVYSLLIPVNYTPFPTRRGGQSFTDLFYWGNIMNNYVAAYLSILGGEGGTLAVGLAVSLLTGYSTMDIFDHPLSASLSPSEFWGQRWNRLVGGLLKRGVYIPLLPRLSKPTAAAITFIISGLLHEYILVLFSLKQDDRTGAHTIKYGNHFLFFAWNGTVLVLEHFLRGTPVINWISTNLPKPAITMLVLLTVLPVSHWFTDECRDTGFFTDYGRGFPRIVMMAPTKSY